MNAQAVAAKSPDPSLPNSDSRAVVRARAAHELFFAVVGPVGAGSSHVARHLVRSGVGETARSCGGRRRQHLVRAAS
jgi:hypothetical protein